MPSRPMIEAFFDEPTNTVSYLVSDPVTRKGAVIDPVLDFDHRSGKASPRSADAILAAAKQAGVEIVWVLETHAHADHLSGAPYVKLKTGAKVGIGEHIRDVQRIFRPVFNATDVSGDGSEFDHLFKDGEHFAIGSLEGEVIHTPGHTPACVSYRIGDAVFVGDTLFMPDYGTARADFPGGDARALYRSIRGILALPAETRLFTCHDYKAPGRDTYAWETTVGEERAHNVHIREGVSEDAFVAMRTSRDATLAAPLLLLPSIQVNIRAGTQAAENLCSDTRDNDCDGQTDCSDTQCNGLTCGTFGRTCSGTACTCSGNGGTAQAAESICNDTRDNDCDGLADCNDTQCNGLTCGTFGRSCSGTACTCSGNGGTAQATESICNDTNDNDCDGQADCNDTQCNGLTCGTFGRTCSGTACTCSGNGGTAQATESICNDTNDNDCDGLADCNDTQCNGLTCGTFGRTCSGTACTCSGNGGTAQAAESICSDTRDNDCDGQADCNDTQCNGLTCGTFGRTCSGTACTCSGNGGTAQAAESICNDTNDNDCDGLVDCNDTQCNGLACGANGRACSGTTCACTGNGGTAQASESTCNDGKDNDCDGLVDCADPQCNGQTCGTNRVCPGAPGACPPGYNITTSPQAFVDACAQAGAVRILQSNDDGASAVMTMPFPFSIFGASVSNFRITANGTISFRPWPSFNDPGINTNCPMRPNADLNPAIYAFRDDLEPGPGGICYATIGASPNRTFVVTWDQAHQCCDGTAPFNETLTFSIFLRETTSVVDLVYQTLNGFESDGSDAIIGIQGADAGTNPAPYTQHSCHTASVSAGTGLRFTFAP